MKFCEEDLRHEVPHIREFLANAPSEKIAFKASQIKEIWGPSSKGYITIVAESYKVFVHRNSVCGQWVLESLGVIEFQEQTLFIKADSMTGRSFEIFKADGSRTIWEASSKGSSGLIARETLPLTQKGAKKYRTPTRPSEAQEGPSTPPQVP